MEISYFFRPWNIYCKSLPRRQQLTGIKLDATTVNELGYAVVRLCREKKVKGYHSLATAQTFGRLMRLSFSRAVSKTDTRKCWTGNLFKAVADKLTDLEFVWTSEPVRQRWRGERGRLWSSRISESQQGVAASFIWLAGCISLLITHLTLRRIQQQTSVSSV